MWANCRARRKGVKSVTSCTLAGVPVESHRVVQVRVLTLTSTKKKKKKKKGEIELTFEQFSPAHIVDTTWCLGEIVAKEWVEGSGGQDIATLSLDCSKVCEEAFTGPKPFMKSLDFSFAPPRRARSTLKG